MCYISILNILLFVTVRLVGTEHGVRSSVDTGGDVRSDVASGGDLTSSVDSGGDVRSSLDSGGDVRSRLWESTLISPGELPDPGNGVIDVAFIMTNVKTNKTEQKTDKLVIQFCKMLDSLFLYSQGTPLRIIFLTDERSRPVIGQMFSQRVGKYISETPILQPPSNNRALKFMFPKLQVEYVRVGEMIRNHREEIDKFRDFFGNLADNKGYTETPWKLSQGISAISWSTKYLADLFYILPFHHLELPPSLKKLILLDVDLEFRIDLLDLYRQFRDWEPSEVIGCGVTQTPFYFTFFEHYRKIEPDTKIGKPGRFQGLNTGVLLLRLDRMRDSELYEASRQVERVREMRKKYQMSGAVGDQDWLTLVSFEYPELIHILGCEYNKEDHRPGECHRDTVEDWEVRDREYHHCPRPIKIRHRAGTI